jgi:hypothetical protein
MSVRNVQPTAELRRLARGRRESDRYRPIIETAAAYGVHLERRNAGKLIVGTGKKRRAITLGKKGTSDLIGWTTRDLFGGDFDSGTVVAVEVKREGETLTPDQRAYLQRVRNDGGLAFMWRTVDDVARDLAGEPARR